MRLKSINNQHQNKSTICFCFIDETHKGIKILNANPVYRLRQNGAIGANLPHKIKMDTKVLPQGSLISASTKNTIDSNCLT